MSDDQPEDAVLRRLPEPSKEPAVIDDGLLLGYQAGKLSPEQTAEVEQLLAKSAEARALLLELSRPQDPSLVDRLERASGLSGRRWVWWSAGCAAIAAVLSLFVIGRPDGIPDYALEAEGFVAMTRGESRAGLSGVLDSESHLVLRLRPDEDVLSPPVFRVLVGPEGGALAPTPAGKLESANGAFRWSADAKDLFSASGRYRMVVTLGEGSDTKEWSLDLEYRAREP
jgi:hypothetical protein